MMWCKRLLAVYRPQHLVSWERERERQAPRGPSGLVTDANFHPLPCTLWLQKTPHMYLVQKTADHIFYLFTGKEEE